jgi:hypothetical protein
MSFNRLDPQDFIVSSDSITATLWTGAVPTLTSFFTSSVQEAGSSGDYYLNVFQSDPQTTSTASIQFAIAYGNSAGSGSALYNPAVAGLSPTATVYGQYQNIVLGDENTDFVFGAFTSSQFWAISFERARYKQSLFPGSLTLELSGSLGVISLTDNSNYVVSQTFNEAGRVFQLISGSAGVQTTATNFVTTDGYSLNSGSYGWLLPDIGTILLNPAALSGSLASGGIGLNYSTVSNAAGSNNQKLYRAISGSTAAVFTINSQETITSDFIFVRARSSEFNYSENPSYISGSTGEVIYPSFINNPQTYITTIGLYNDTNELLAVAKLSRPLLKDFTKEALVRVKLDF